MRAMMVSPIVMLKMVLTRSDALRLGVWEIRRLIAVLVLVSHTSAF